MTRKPYIRFERHHEGDRWTLHWNYFYSCLTNKSRVLEADDRNDERPALKEAAAYLETDEAEIEVRGF